MKLLRFGAPSEERPGILDAQGRVRDLSGHIPDIHGGTLNRDTLDRLRKVDVNALPTVESSVRIGPCVAGVGKIVGVGLNYRRHAMEAGADVPSEPVLFSKAITAISGPNDDVILPSWAQKADWEVELAVVIGEIARDVPASAAFEVVAGYCIMNDVSDRALQLEGTGQWLKGKSLDTFGPLGPWLVTCDEVPNPQALEMWLELNGSRVQHSSTADMVFPVPHLVSYISRFMTLLPGDIIATGTPHGVGMGHRPPRYLRAGDEMRLEVKGLGEQRQVVRNET